MTYPTYKEEATMTETRTTDMETEVQATNPTRQEKTIPAVPDNCSNCPDSSCCPFANDRWHGKAGYSE